MCVSRILRTLEQPLLGGLIDLPRSATQLAGLELEARLRIVEPAELEIAGVAGVAQQIGRVAELLHHRDPGIVPQTEIDAMELIAAEVAIGVVRTGHRVKLGRNLIASANAPRGAGITRHRSVDWNTQGIAAETKVLCEAVQRRGREIVERVDASGDDVELLIEKLM